MFYTKKRSQSVPPVANTGNSQWGSTSLVNNIPSSAEESKKSISDGLKIQDGNARWTDERIDRLIKEYGASVQDYSKAYAVLMNPRDYLKLTLSDDMLDRWNEGANAPEHPEVYDPNENELRDNEQTPFLTIFSNDGGEVYGHGYTVRHFLAIV